MKTDHESTAQSGWAWREGLLQSLWSGEPRHAWRIACPTGNCRRSAEFHGWVAPLDNRCLERERMWVLRHPSLADNVRGWKS
jgi:hypothetical protein